MYDLPGMRVSERVRVHRTVTAGDERFLYQIAFANMSNIRSSDHAAKNTAYSACEGTLILLPNVLIKTLALEGIPKPRRMISRRVTVLQLLLWQPTDWVRWRNYHHPCKLPLPLTVVVKGSLKKVVTIIARLLRAKSL
jgi:hypothetical protein